MASSFQIWMDGQPVAADFYDRITTLQVEENADLPGALQLRLPVARREDGDLTNVNETGLQPLHNIAVMVAPDDGAVPECIFDGYVLSHKLHMKSGLRSSYLEVFAQDASWLLNLEEKTREWANTTDGAAANTVFGEHGITPGPDNLTDDSGPYTEEAHTLMQRGTDLEFLRTLARRSGRLCRVTSGPAPGVRIGVFAKPALDGRPAATLKPNDPEAPNVREIEFEWDVMRPTAVTARQALFTDNSPSGLSGDASDSGLSALDDRDLAAFAGEANTMILTAPADDAGQLNRRAQALVRDAGWFVRCSGEVSLGALRSVIRVGGLVTVEGVGGVHSGKYFVWSVRHQIEQQDHRMRFTLMRNAVGPEPSSSGGGPIGALPL